MVAELDGQLSEGHDRVDQGLEVAGGGSAVAVEQPGDPQPANHLAGGLAVDGRQRDRALGTSSTSVPPAATTTSGPSSGSRTMPERHLHPASPGAAPARAGPSRAARSSYAAPTASRSPSPSRTPSASVLWWIASSAVLSTTGQPIPRPPPRPRGVDPTTVARATSIP